MTSTPVNVTVGQEALVKIAGRIIPVRVEAVLPDGWMVRSATSRGTRWRCLAPVTGRHRRHRRERAGAWCAGRVGLMTRKVGAAPLRVRYASGGGRDPPARRRLSGPGAGLGLSAPASAGRGRRAACRRGS